MITKFKRPEEENNNNVLVIATIEDYRLTARFGRILPDVGAVNPYDIELIGLENGERKRFAVLNFWDEEPLRNASFSSSQDQYELTLPSGSYASIVDLLRQEKPVQIHINQKPEHDGLISGFLRTVSG